MDQVFDMQVSRYPCDVIKHGPVVCAFEGRIIVLCEHASACFTTSWYRNASYRNMCIRVFIFYILCVQLKFLPISTSARTDVEPCTVRIMHVKYCCCFCLHSACISAKERVSATQRSVSPSTTVCCCGTAPVLPTTSALFHKVSQPL